ncbi:MAG: threonine synthase [Bacillota bacterium]|nr:threonine synthase [Bacillota bacterium]
MFYQSTRESSKKVLSSEAIVRGICEDGGLFVPDILPKLDKKLDELKSMNYRELAFYVMSKFFTDFKEEELKDCINKAYDDKFDTSVIAPLVKKGDASFLELFHGPTIAFKDMALSILPHLLKTAARNLNINKEIVILTATSGDTGKAALEGFTNVDGVKIIVFFPQDGVSEIQKMQMVTQKGENTFVVGVKGNFDDCQTGVKNIFSDKEYNKKLDDNNIVFSSANSINIGRLVPQIVYYFYSYIQMCNSNEINVGDSINFVVPTGNFGNILAAYYAKKMGLPINKLICASNENNVLYDFINTGVYDKRRELKLTISPSMDILVSSNLERLLVSLNDGNREQIKNMMDSLTSKGIYEITDEMKKGLISFYGGYSTEQETHDTIKNVFEQENYLLDTHTAVAYSVYEKYKDATNDVTKTVVVSTASPFKFTRSVMTSIDAKYDEFTDFELVEKMAELSKVRIPAAIKDINKREIKHGRICEVDEMKSVVADIINVSI